MIRRPDEYAHQNDSLAIVDESNVRGGRLVVQNLQELYGLYAYQDKLKDNVTIVRVISEDKDYRLIDKNNANNSAGWIVNSVSSPPEIQVSKTEPTDVNIKLWGKQGLSDLDILRQIRDANPTSQLPNLWAESKDPYTEWWDENDYKGALFGSDTRIDQLASIIGFTVPPIGDRNPYKVYVLNLSYTSISALPSVNKLSNLLYINCFGNLLLTLDVSNSFILRLECGSNQIATLNMSNVPTLQTLMVSHNKLVSIPTLTSKGLITNYSFLYNNMPPNETDRLIFLGFTSDKVLPQNL